MSRNLTFYYSTDKQFKIQQSIFWNICNNTIKNYNNIRPSLCLMQKSIQQIRHINSTYYFETLRQKHGSSLVPITYDAKDNKQAAIKYDGYMRIQKRKLQDGKDKGDQYMESIYLKDLVGGRKNTSQAIQKFVKINKINLFGGAQALNSDMKVPKIQEIQNMSLGRDKR